MRLSVIARLAPLFVTLPLLGEPMTGLTSTGALVRFDSATPGTFTSGPTAITGLTAGYTVVSIDRRPATGQLYALTFNFAAVGIEMQVYTLNETTGAGTALGSPFAAPRAIGSTLSAATRFGFDFDPVSDVMRVVSTGRDNFRVIPTTGAIAGSDTILTPAGTQVTGAAYSNNVSGATSTTLYAIDTSTNPDQLVFIGGNPVPAGASPNGGVTTIVGSLGVDTSAGDLGFEITSTGTALAAMAVSGTSGLYTINLGTGAASLIGGFQGGAIVTGLTSGIGIPDPPNEPMVGLTSTGALVGFDSATPGTFTSGPTFITGLTAGYTVVSIDRRPATGQLYALTFNFAAVGTEMQVYIVNETTGVAAALGSAFAAPRAIGSTLSAATRFGFDFSPVSDVMRVVSTGRDNFRVSPITGAVLGSDTILTPAGTQVPGAAYSNNVSGATSTTLYAIDSGASPDQLVFIGGNPVPPGASPNGGVATVVGPLGPETLAGDLGFEITASGTALAAMAVSGTSGLYTINLGSGAASLIGGFQGGAIVRGLTSGPGIIVPPSEPMVGLTSTGALVGFDSATPGTFTSGPTAITGTAGYAVVSIDRRPATGQLYALTFNFAVVGAEMQVYTVNETTGVATALGSAFAAPRAIGSTLSAATRFGFDFDPVIDVMRVVSTGRDNFRVSPVTGAVLGSHTILTPSSTQVPGAAYSNNVSGATSTTLYAIDTGASPDQLVVIGGNPVPPGASPDGGVATLVGPLGPETSAGDLGFEITASGTALTAMAVSGTSGLYTVSLDTGAASLIGGFQGGATVTGLTSGIILADPTLTTQASAGVIIGGAVNDDGTLVGGTTPTGTITFDLYGPNDATCTGAVAFTAIIPVAGNGVYNSGNFTPTLAGTYRWVATYSGDVNNNPVTSPCNAPNESVEVSPASPTLTTQASAGVTIGGSVNDNGTLAGGASPTGSITFNLYGPNDATCAGVIAFTATIPVAGNGVYNSGNFTPASVGTYRWVASYSGDANNAPATSPCNAPNESVVVSPAGASVSGTKTAAPGPYAVGSNVTYTIILTNSGLGSQADNPGNEFIDVLPPTLQLVSATATSGSAVATVGTNTVTWNGSLAPAASVTITITATILPSAAGTTVNNQGTINYDADGNGTNESTAQTDDPAVAGAGNPTGIAVPANGMAIPTLSPFALLLMCALLAGIAFLKFTRMS